MTFPVRISRPRRALILTLLAALVLCPGRGRAQPTGPQQLAFTGLRALASQGQFNAVQSTAHGDLYLLLDQKDGVRVLKTDSAATNVLAQAQIGAKGDIGLALALDPAGNVYVTGTTTSGALTATSGAAFTRSTGAGTNSFVAKFDSDLNTVFVSFAGGSAMAASSLAATADAVFVAGSIYSATLPVTSGAILQTPASGSSSNGFVQKFSANGSTLLYATYLTGAIGDTSVSAIAADSSDNAYVAGTTTASGFPTVAALVPAILGSTSGFLTRVTPAGDGITFSTFIPGDGLSSLALDPDANTLLLSGTVALGQFPVSTIQAPLAPVPYQVFLRMPLDGSAVLTSTLVAPGTQSFVTSGSPGTAWVDGALTLPLLPLTPLASSGNSFAVHVSSAGAVDQTARFGGLPNASPASVSAPVNLTSLTADPSGQPIVAGSFAPSASQSLLATETFDLPLVSAPTVAFPATVHDAVLPASACHGSLCSGSAAFLAKLILPASPASAYAALALSVDDAPNLTLRNLGSAQATGVVITASGFTFSTNCTSTLAAAAECSLVLSGSGPGILTVSAANAPAQTQTIPAFTAAPQPVVFSPREIDFGIVSSASGAVLRTFTVSNLTQLSQTFASALDTSSRTVLPYTLAQQTSDCTSAGGQGSYLLAPGGSCHITLALTASPLPANDGLLQQNWRIGARDLLLTAYTQTSALSLSAAEIDFGTQYTAGLRLPRFLYLSNNSTLSYAHAPVTLPATSPFTVTDKCPATLAPHSICQLALGYNNAYTPAADAVTLSLDAGLTALVTGRSLPQPSASGSSANPNLSLSATALTFATPVVVTGLSSSTQTLTVTNTGASAFALTLVLSGDFSFTTGCTATLAAHASCGVVLTFIPSAPGTRNGVLAIAAGANTAPAFVSLSGTGLDILSPVTNGTLNFGAVLAGQPSIQWYKVTQPFTTFAAVTASSTLGAPFTAILVEDIGYGHGQPPASAFNTSSSGTCLNCWLGVRFTPVNTGPETGSVVLTSAPGGSPYALSLTGIGLPVSGLLITPPTQDFGSVPVNSSSPPALFTLTNLVPAQTSITVANPLLTGDFTLSSAVTGAPACGGPLAYAASCILPIVFTPNATGPRTGTLSLQTASTSVTASLTGYGAADPSLALNPTVLVFANTPPAASTLQTLTLTNTGATNLQVGNPSTGTASFSVSSGCGTLLPGGTCTVTVRFTPSTAQLTDTLTLPVTTLSGPAIYTVPLTGAYTTEDSGIQIVPGQVQYGPAATGSLTPTRQFTVNNLTGRSLALTVALPRQFVLAGPPCAGLAPFASCTFSAAFLPLDNGDLTGTLFAQATPTDGSATLNGLGYVEGYGIGAASLSFTGGGLLPGNVLNFNQVPSGQALPRTLTLTNTSTLPLTIRRITSGWPFLTTTTCGSTLAPAQTCTVTVTYTPLNQVAPGIPSPSTLTDIDTLIVESDAASSPDLIDLTGMATPAVLVAPSNIAPLAALTASQSSLTFPATQAGNVSAPQTVTLANTGTSTLHILGLQTSPDFTVAGSCGILVPAASCALTVAFTPQNATQLASGTGARISALEIASDASTSLEFISLVGSASPSTLQLTPAAVNFPTVLVGASTTLPVTVSNLAALPATLGALAAMGDFSASPGSCPAAGSLLPGNSTCTLQVTFAPSRSGSRTGTLTLASSATTLPLTLPLTGTGAQSHLQILPASLDFGAIPLNASASLSLTLANTGTAPITGVALAVPGDYAITVPCALSTLTAGASCSVTLTFTPTAAGPRNATLVVTSSDATSPAAVPLTGTGALDGSFTFTANGASSASAYAAIGAPASYALSVTPRNGFTGTVVLNCSPVTPAAYAYCALLPSSLILTSGPQTATATLNTVSSIARSVSADPAGGLYARTVLALLFPTLLLSWKARTSRRRLWRRTGPVAWAFFASIVLASALGCGGSSPTSSNLRFAAPGTYQYQVTASSTAGNAPVSQTVTLNLTIQ